MDLSVTAYNRTAWDHQVASGNRWTKPVSPEVIAAARRGEWSVVLTEQAPVPREWFQVRGGTGLHGLDVLGLASGGGQQAPVFAAAGARVTVVDNSPRQLAQDRFVAEREGLALTLVEGDMRDLSAFADATFDLVFHPVSNLYAPEVRPVWRECFRVLRSGGVLQTGFMNPACYLFEYAAQYDDAPLTVKQKLPYSDEKDLPPEEIEKSRADGTPLEHSHTLTDQIGGQLDAGFVLTGFYEDYQSQAALSRYMPTYLATRAVKR